MKKSIFLFLCTAILVILFACNQSSKNAEANERGNHAEAQTKGLMLNNGAKWQSDSSTNRNVTDLRTIADNFKIPPHPSLNEYHILGRDLSNSLNKMIQECRMKGPDHDALHHWLEPVLKGSNQLKDITDTTTGRTTFDSINKQLDIYHNYFK
jgi:hypothetical protein